MRNYYTVFDMEYNLIGLGPHTQSLAVLNMLDVAIPTDILDAPDYLTIEGLGIFSNIVGFIVIVIVLACICNCCQNGGTIEDSS